MAKKASNGISQDQGIEMSTTEWIDATDEHFPPEQELMEAAWVASDSPILELDGGDAELRHYLCRVYLYRHLEDSEWEYELHQLETAKELEEFVH